VEIVVVGGVVIIVASTVIAGCEHQKNVTKASDIQKSKPSMADIAKCKDGACFNQELVDKASPQQLIKDLDVVKDAGKNLTPLAAGGPIVPSSNADVLVQTGLTILQGLDALRPQNGAQKNNKK